MAPGTTFAFTNSLSNLFPNWKTPGGEGTKAVGPLPWAAQQRRVSVWIQNPAGPRSATSTRLFVKGKIQAAAFRNKAVNRASNLKSGAAALNNIQLKQPCWLEERPNPPELTATRSSPYLRVLGHLSEWAMGKRWPKSARSHQAICFQAQSPIRLERPIGLLCPCRGAILSTTTPERRWERIGPDLTLVAGGADHPASRLRDVFGGLRAPLFAPLW